MAKTESLTAAGQSVTIGSQYDSRRYSLANLFFHISSEGESSFCCLSRWESSQPQRSIKPTIAGEHIAVNVRVRYTSVRSSSLRFFSFDQVGVRSPASICFLSSPFIVFEGRVFWSDGAERVTRTRMPESFENGGFFCVDIIMQTPVRMFGSISIEQSEIAVKAVTFQKFDIKDEVQGRRRSFDGIITSVS